MVTNQEKEKVFNALVVSGIEFLSSSVGELDSRPKFSVAHFSTGLELVLKARLFAEHWALVAANPHGASWPQLTGGTLQTIQASKLCDTIETVVGIPLTSQRKVFQSVFRHRNRILHFMPVEDPVEIAGEQLRAWFHLYGLLRDKWRKVFAEHQATFKGLDELLRSNRKYLITVFEEKGSLIDVLAAENRITECRSCGFGAGEIESPSSLVSQVRCHVCEDSYAVIQFGCGEHHELTWDTPEYSCECGTTHKLDDLVSEYDECREMSPKDELIAGPGRYRCGDCLDPEPRVVPIERDYTCLSCGVNFGDQGPQPCEWCHELWVGYDLEGSYLSGCELCEGQLGWGAD